MLSLYLILTYFSQALSYQDQCFLGKAFSFIEEEAIFSEAELGSILWDWFP